MLAGFQGGGERHKSHIPNTHPHETFHFPGCCSLIILPGKNATLFLTPALGNKGRFFPVQPAMLTSHMLHFQILHVKVKWRKPRCSSSALSPTPGSLHYSCIAHGYLRLLIQPAKNTSSCALCEDQA